MNNYFKKRDKKEKNDQFIQKYLVAKLADSGITGKVDSYGNIKYESNSKQYRYHIKERVVTKEVQSVSTATEYSPANKSWVRVKSFSYKDLMSVGQKYFDSKVGVL